MQTIFLRTVSQVAEALHEDAHWLSEEEEDDALFDDVRSDVTALALPSLCDQHNLLIVDELHCWPSFQT